MNQRLFDILLAEKNRAASLSALVAVAAVLGAVVMYGVQKSFFSPQSIDSHEVTGVSGEPSGREEEAAHSGQGEEGGESELLILPKEKWKNAGVRVAPAKRATLKQKGWVTGKLTINEDRTAHIFPLVSGRTHSVNVRFGQKVKAGEVLAVIDSRELGDAKLALYQSRLETHIAQVNDDWAREINENTQALIKALEKGTPLSELEVSFREKPMGENRSKLLTAYANLYRSKVDYQRLQPLGAKGIASGKQLLAAKAAFEADQATFRAWLEQLKFTAWQNSLFQQQALDKAQAIQTINLSKLSILGYSPKQLKNIDPRVEGEAIAHYEVQAPFDGTIVRKNVVLQERTGPNTQLFELTDLSTLWLRADIYQKHLPLLRNLSNNTIRFRVNEYGHIHQAKVFYRGEVIDPKTRTARLVATVANPDGHLKPGMFVDVELPGAIVPDVLQVPAEAVQSYENQSFVFLHVGGEKFVRRNVTTGQTGDGLIEIRSGLKPEEPVVVEGAFSLKSEMLKELMADED